MPLKIETQKVFSNAVRTGAFAVANALLAADQSDSNLRICEAFPKDRESLGCLWQFILDEYAGLSEPLKQEVPKLLDLRVISKEEPPLNALEHFVLKGKYDHAKAVLLLAPGLKISEAFPKDRASLGCLWQFILDEYAGLSEPLKQEVPKLLDLRVISKEERPYNAFNVFLCSNNDERCLKTLTHASEIALQPHHPDDEEMMDRALWRIIQAQLAKRGLRATEESPLESTLKDIMGPEHPVGTETLRGFIVVLATETAQQQHFHEFCTLHSRIAGAEQKKALIEATTASMFFQHIFSTQHKPQCDAVYDALRVQCADMLAGISGLSFYLSLVVFPFFLILSLECMYSNVVSYSMLDILQFWKPHVANVLAYPYPGARYQHVISAPINAARVFCLLLLILLTLCVCSLLGTHISVRSVKRKQCQALDSQIQEDQSALNETKQALAQQVTETVEKPKLYQSCQRLAFMLMGGRNHDPVQIDNCDIEHSVGKRLVDQSSQQPLLTQEQMDQFESDTSTKIMLQDQQQQAQSARRIQSVFRGFCVRRSVGSSAQCAPQAVPVSAASVVGVGAIVSGSAPAP